MYHTNASIMGRREIYLAFHCRKTCAQHLLLHTTFSSAYGHKEKMCLCVCPTVSQFYQLGKLGAS